LLISNVKLLSNTNVRRTTQKNLEQEGASLLPKSSRILEESWIELGENFEIAMCFPLIKIFCSSNNLQRDHKGENLPFFYKSSTTFKVLPSFNIQRLVH